MVESPTEVVEGSDEEMADGESLGGFEDSLVQQTRAGEEGG